MMLARRGAAWPGLLAGAELSVAVPGDDGPVQVGAGHGAVVRSIAEGVHGAGRRRDPVAAAVRGGEDGVGRVEPVEVAARGRAQVGRTPVRVDLSVAEQDPVALAV